MNIKNLYVTAVVGIALLSGWNVSRIMSEKASLSDMALANVEALAQESIIGYQCWETVSGTTGSTYRYEKTYCLTCSVLPVTSWSNENICVK